MKKTTCALLVSDGTSVLAGLPTGKKDGLNQYDIAGKGCLDPGETELEAAVRELQEETGLEADPRSMSIKDLGRFPYTREKDLHLFSLHVDEMPKAETLHCDSTFESYGRELPELSAFRIVMTDDLEWFYPALQPILRSVLSKNWLSKETLPLSTLKVLRRPVSRVEKKTNTGRLYPHTV